MGVGCVRPGGPDCEAECEALSKLPRRLPNVPDRLRNASEVPKPNSCVSCAWAWGKAIAGKLDLEEIPDDSHNLPFEQEVLELESRGGVVNRHSRERKS